MRLQQFIECLKTAVSTDLQSSTSVIAYFVSQTLSGGWESWLQTILARALGGRNLIGDFNREVPYPGVIPVQKCDLWFLGERGTGIYLELKTQRNKNYAATVKDFSADIIKILALPTKVRTEQVIAAIAVLSLANADRVGLDAIRTSGVSGEIKIYMFVSAWIDVTETIKTEPLGGLIIATFVPASPI